MESRLAKSASRSPWKTFGLAVAAPIAALLIRLALVPVLNERLTYLTFFLASGVSATYGGFGPGLVTGVLGAILALTFVVPPVGALRVDSIGDLLGALLFVGISALISSLAGGLIEAKHRANAVRLLFEQTLMSIGDAVISTDKEKIVRLINPAAEKLTGWSRTEARGRSIDEVFRVVQEGSDSPAEFPLDRVLEAGEVVELANHTELICRTGERVSIDDSAAPVRDAAGRVAGAVIVFRDVSDRRRAQQEFVAAERRARSILESISDAFIVLDHDWRYAQLNAAAESMLGASAASLIGRNYWEMQPAASGTEVEHLFRKAITEQVAVHLEHHQEPGDRCFDIRAYPSAEGLVIYARDISERKQHEQELRRLNDDLKQFTFAATHDLREPLRMIIIYTQMLQRELADSIGDDSHEYLRQVISGAQRISRLSEGLLEFSRIGELHAVQPSAVDTESALRDALENLRIAVTESQAEILCDAMPPVVADQMHVCQLFQNLIGNALKYHAPGTRPLVRVSAARQGSHSVFAVQDNGMGIDPEHQTRIFVPFERLHGAEISGAGIGLATCKRIVERYGGRIWVESKPGEGATFYFSLPAAERAGHAV